MRNQNQNPNKEMNGRERLRLTVQAGLFAALTALFTAVVHIPAGNGYIHCGDALIYLAAAMLPLPHAMLAGAVGGMLADLVSGYAVYALPTFLIKALTALVFGLLCGKRFAQKQQEDAAAKPSLAAQLAAMLLAGLVTVSGYYITAVLLYGGFAAQLSTVPGNLLQAGGSALLYFAVRRALDQMDPEAHSMLA